MSYILTIDCGLEYANISYNLKRQGGRKGLPTKSQELFVKVKFLLIYN